MPNTMTSDFKPAELDIEIVKGDYWVQTFALSVDDNPINLSNEDVHIEITQGCSTTVLWEANEGDGITIGGVSNNQINLSKLVNLDEGNYEYTLKVTYMTGVVKTYLWGSFKVYLDKP
jgi:FlaG/FlaF family flagellin (archaellin)